MNRYTAWPSQPFSDINPHFMQQALWTSRGLQAAGTGEGPNKRPRSWSQKSPSCCQVVHAAQPQPALLFTTEHRQHYSVTTDLAQWEPCLFSSTQLPHSSTQKPAQQAAQEQRTQPNTPGGSRGCGVRSQNKVKN